MSEDRHFAVLRKVEFPKVEALMPAWGINHHGTRPGYLAKAKGMFSLGCSVRLHWKDHLEFIELLRTDPRYLAEPRFRFSAAYLDGGKVWTACL